MKTKLVQAMPTWARTRQIDRSEEVQRDAQGHMNALRNRSFFLVSRPDEITLQQSSQDVSRVFSDEHRF